MIIFGTRGYLRVLTIVNFICNNCHNPAAQRVTQRLMKFTLFFIPLFPVSSSYHTTCTFCGATTKIDKGLAETYVAHAQQTPTPSAPAGGMPPQSFQQPVQQSQYPQPQPPRQ